jgi:hypothetical protein
MSTRQNGNKDLNFLGEELINRVNNDEGIDGDMNFCISRLLVLATDIHTEPRYSKIVWIQKVLEGAKGFIIHFFGQKLWSLGTLNCVQMELYRRYGASYESEKMKINGDIVD